MPQVIYYTGKPHPLKKEVMDAVKQRGYETGVILDKSVTLSGLDTYDHVVRLDFTTTENLLAQLKDTELHAAGLLCTYENYIVAKSVIGTQLGLAVNSIESAKKSTDKFLMRQAFMKYNPSITPKFGIAATDEEARTVAAKLTYPLIIKPTNLVKSLLVLKCKNETELLKNFHYALSASAELYKKYRVYEHHPALIIEEYITGTVCSIAAFVDAYGQPHFCKGITGLVTAQDKHINDNNLYSRILPADISEPLEKQLFSVAEKGIKALGMRSTPAHIELIYNDSAIKLIEIGARIGGYRPKMYRQSYNLNLIQAEVDIALGTLPNLHGSFKSYSAIYELFPEVEGVFKTIITPPDATAYTSISVKAMHGQRIGPAKNGYKACAVITIVNRDKSIFDRLCQSVDEVRIVLT